MCGEKRDHLAREEAPEGRHGSRQPWEVYMRVGGGGMTRLGEGAQSTRKVATLLRGVQVKAQGLDLC